MSIALEKALRGFPSALLPGETATILVQSAHVGFIIAEKQTKWPQLQRRPQELKYSYAAFNVDNENLSASSLSRNRSVKTALRSQK